MKGGENLSRNMIGDLSGVMRRERAPLAVLISLREPTAGMVKEAAAAGLFETPFGRFPRIQIVTVESLLEGKLPKLPPQDAGAGFKRTPEQAHREPSLGLDMAGMPGQGKAGPEPEDQASKPKRRRRT